jgi:uncharacterized membrane protein YkoI
MKKIIFYSAVLSLGILSSCDDKKLSASQVPQPAMNAFNAKYPGATNVEWKTEKEDGKTIYEAAFKLNAKKIEAEFDGNGSFITEE